MFVTSFLKMSSSELDFGEKQAGNMYSLWHSGPGRQETADQVPHSSMSRTFLHTMLHWPDESVSYLQEAHRVWRPVRWKPRTVSVWVTEVSVICNLYASIDCLIGLGVSISWGCGFDSQHFNNLKCELGLERDPPSLMRTIGFILDWEVLDLIKKVNINRLITLFHCTAICQSVADV